MAVPLNFGGHSLPITTHSIPAPDEILVYRNGYKRFTQAAGMVSQPLSGFVIVLPLLCLVEADYRR